MCINCKINKVDKTYSVKGRGSGSIFDLDEFDVELCNECAKKLGIKEEWFTEKPNISKDYYEKYKFENYIKNILVKLKIGNYVNLLS